MTDQAIKPADTSFDIQDVERRLKAIFIGSIGNLVEWYDFYALRLRCISHRHSSRTAIRSCSNSTPRCCSPRPS